MTDERSIEPTKRTTGRRSVLGTVGGTIAGVTALGTVSSAGARDAGMQDQEQEQEQQQAAEAVDATVREAFAEQETLLESGRYCSVDEAVLGSIDRDVGDQVRVRRADAEGEYAVYTVSESRNEEDDAIVRMGLDGRERLGTDETFDATVDPTVPRPDLSVDGAQANDEFIEHLNYGGDRVAVLSPHGGDISPETDDQADIVAQNATDATRWGCKGWREDGGAFERWYVSPQDISRRSFPELNRIYDRGFEYAVSFRGLEGAGVDVVGDEDGAFTQDIADAIESAVEDIEVVTHDLVIDGGDARYEDDQLTARLAAADGRSVWLGQSREAREDHGEAIASAVADVLEERG